MPGSTDLIRSRRTLLTAALGAAAATAATALGRPLGVAAVDTGTISIGGDYTDVRSTTSLTNTTNNKTILFADMEPQGDGAQTNGGVAITGISSAVDGAGVHGHSPHFSGLRGTSLDGFGVRGDCASNIGVYATSAHGVGVNAQGGHIGVYATSPGGTGISAFSGSGRAGTFEGRDAQVRLIPASAAGHPHSGKPGDLFVDKHARLWFCKGGTSWRQLT